MKLHVRLTLFTLAAALVAVGLASPSFATDKMGDKKAEHNVADTWVFWPKQGQFQAFEAGMKKHVAWRKRAGDPFQWKVYEPVVGSNLDRYAVQSSNHAWGDLDSENAWGDKSGAGKQFSQDVGQHVDKMQHIFIVTNEKLSHWIDDEGYRYFGVTSYRFKGGHSAGIKDVLKQIHAAATSQKWPYSYLVRYTVGGSGGMSIVEPMENWAGMAEPSPSLMELMTRALGSKEAAQKLIDKFSSAIKERDYTVWHYRPDLSTPQ